MALSEKAFKRAVGAIGLCMVATVPGPQGSSLATEAVRYVRAATSANAPAQPKVPAVLAPASK